MTAEGNAIRSISTMLSDQLERAISERDQLRMECDDLRAERDVLLRKSCRTCGSNNVKVRQKMWISPGNFGYCSDPFHKEAL